MTRTNSDLDRTNARQSHRPKRRPVQCFLPRLGRKPRDRRRLIDLLVHTWSLDEMAIDLAMVDTYTALTAAGFPWPTEPVDGETEADEPHDCDKEYRADCASCNGVAPGDVGRW